MSCLFCKSNDTVDSFLPSTFFNQKRFDYKRCNNCRLHFIAPIPNKDDLLKMYPTSYQAGVDDNILADPYKKLIGLRFSYGKQIELLRKNNFSGKVLDFGCGSANFLINCNHHGIECDGLEFNPDHVNILKEKVSDRKFYTFDEFMESDIQYDLIRLSNVLEHFTDPVETIIEIKKHIKPNGYLLVEGPIEMNFNLAQIFRKVYFSVKKRLKRNYLATHTPTHIIFSNRSNQLNFFQNLQFDTLWYVIDEAEWPFPNSLKNAIGMVSKLNFYIAKLSMLFGKTIPSWGNTFLYLGRIK